jgi:hypothetical protein
MDSPLNLVIIALVDTESDFFLAFNFAFVDPEPSVQRRHGR